MAAKKQSNVVGFLTIALGIFLIISGVLGQWDSIVRSMVMAVGFFSLVYGIIGYKK